MQEKNKRLRGKKHAFILQRDDVLRGAGQTPAPAPKQRGRQVVLGNPLSANNRQSQHNLDFAKSPARSQRVTPIEGRKRPTGLRNVDEERGEGGIHRNSRRNGQAAVPTSGDPKAIRKPKRSEREKKTKTE